MNSCSKISYYFRKYALLRVACFAFILGVGFSIFFLVQNKNKPAPVIEKINPPVGAPGDIIVISGQNFGTEREPESSYVEFAGVKLTSSSYVNWSDTQIKIVLPANVQDGLVVVGTKNMRSNSTFFANDEEIPVLVPEEQINSKPSITNISSSSLAVGQILKIEGTNFGELRNKSKVLFTADYNNRIKNVDYITSSMLVDKMVEVSESEYGYVSWNNNEIKVRVPDGAYTGVVLVTNGKDSSEPVPFTVNNAAGTKEYINKKQFLLQYEVNIRDLMSDDNGTLSIRCPVPEVFASQPSVQITEISPTPSQKDYQKCNVQQISVNRNNVMNENLTQTFIIDSYEIKTSVKSDKIASVKENNKDLFNTLCYPDEIIPADNEDVANLVKTIIGKENNQYKKAQLIYNYMCNNYEVLSKTRKDDADPLELLSRNKGDAYDFAVIFAALARTAGVSTNINCGILINQNLKTQAHWWNEIYLQNFGWVPVDVALGCGMEWKKWPDIENVHSYYFGNLDAYHICFSRGLNQLKAFAQENSVVRFYRSFALQTVWEEASSTISSYSAYWNLPIVKGVYQ